ncbi:hypothetical protein BH10BAC1_BH10BAC1_11040 [soil metagenome]
MAEGTSYSQSSKTIDSLHNIVSTETGMKKFNALMSISLVYRNAGAAPKSIAYCKEALLIAIKEKNKSAEANSNNEIGLCFQAQLKWDEALKYYLKALSLNESIPSTLGVAMTESNIGNVYRDMRNYKNAVEHLNRAQIILKELGDESNLASLNSNLGALYYDMNELENSVVCFEVALSFYKKFNDKNNIAILENNIGSIYNELAKYPQAIENYKNALELFLNRRDSSSIAMCYANIGNVYNVMGDNKQGVEYASHGLDIATRIKDKSLISSCYIFLEEGFRNRGDFARALEYQTLLLNLKDTIYDLQTNQNIAEMQTRFDTDKKENENKILKQENDLQILSINRQKIINYSISVGLLLVMVLAFFIYRGYKQKQKANLQLEEKNVLIEEKNKIVEEKNKDITDSIRYAKRLQTAILKPQHELGNYFEDGFILFKPKDIVSGDFYWFEKFGNLSLFAAADCTGHGVPGAFMSIIGCNLLSQAVNEYAITQPAAILNSINKGLGKVLQQKGDADSFVTDGMDIALCSFNSEKMIVEYSGAYNPMWIIRNNELLEFTADKFPVGAFLDSQVRKFNCHEIPVQKGDMIYVFSDGYADQFGGPLGKKFKYKPMQKLLLENYKNSGAEQKLALNKAFESWIGDLEQIDDVLVIGIRI